MPPTDASAIFFEVLYFLTATFPLSACLTRMPVILPFDTLTNAVCLPFSWSLCSPSFDFRSPSRSFPL